VHASETGWRIYPVTDEAGLAALWPAWEALEEPDAAAEPFVSAAWHRSWWHAYGAGRQPLALAAHSGGQVRGIAPLMRTQGSLRGLPVRLISFMENGASSRCDFVVGEAREEVIQATLDYVGRCAAWDVLLLRKIPTWSPTHEILPGLLQRQGMRYAVHESLQSPYLKITQDWEKFFAGRSAKLRKECRGNLRRLRAVANVETEEITDVPRFNRVLPEICTVAERSWKAPLGTALSSGQHLTFFKRLAQEAGRKGELSVWTLRIGGQMIAFEVHLRHRDINHGLRSEFDERYRDYAPGSVLHHALVKALFESGRKGYDLGGGLALYKTRWTDDCLKHVDIVAFSPRLPGRMLHAFEYGAVTWLREARNWARRRRGRGNDSSPRYSAVRVI
jgi:CelD/BcsL family acetyltransferase involved in cellulose biosynthesis